MTSNINISIKSLSDIGIIVRKKRKEMKMSQTKVALLCGVGIRFISELENGKTTLHMGKVMQVIQGIGFDLLLVTRNKNFSKDTP